MGYFGATLQALLARNKISQTGPASQTELAKATGLSQAHISRLIAEGKQSQERVSRNDLQKIITNVSTNDTDRAELLVAHLRDEIEGPVSNLIECRVAGKSFCPLEQDEHKPLTKFQKDLVKLAGHEKNRRVRFLVRGIAELLEEVSSFGAVKAGHAILDAAFAGTRSEEKLRSARTRLTKKKVAGSSRQTLRA